MLGRLVHSSRISVFSVRWLSCNVKVSLFFLLFHRVLNQTSWVSITTSPKVVSIFSARSIRYVSNHRHIFNSYCQIRLWISFVYISPMPIKCTLIEIFLFRIRWASVSRWRDSLEQWYQYLTRHYLNTQQPSDIPAYCTVLSTLSEDC